MDLDKQAFLNEIDQQIEAKHVLKAPFYKAWSEGKLSKECLKEYALQYYHHVKAFPQYLSVLHSHTSDAETRKTILQNLVDEELGSPNHPELWREFAMALGATANEIDAHQPNKEMQALIDAFMSTCRDGSVSDGIAALYAYESQIPSVSISKIDGLKKFYGMTKPSDWKYFSVHIEADEKHAQEERELLEKTITSSDVISSKKSVNNVLDGLLNFLSSQYQMAC